MCIHVSNREYAGNHIHVVSVKNEIKPALTINKPRQANHPQWDWMLHLMHTAGRCIAGRLYRGENMRAMQSDSHFHKGSFRGYLSTRKGNLRVHLRTHQSWLKIGFLRPTGAETTAQLHCILLTAAIPNNPIFVCVV